MMPIEPTNVSKTLVREVDNVSENGLWNSRQGRSTGGKDGPFNSIWEKTILGAQKLLGLNRSEEIAQQSEENEKREEKSALDEQSIGRKDSFNAVPGFGSRSFGSFSRARDANAFASVASNRISHQATDAFESESPDLSLKLDADGEWKSKDSIRSDDNRERKTKETGALHSNSNKVKPKEESDDSEEEDAANRLENRKTLAPSATIGLVKRASADTVSRRSDSVRTDSVPSPESSTGKEIAAPNSDKVAKVVSKNVDTGIAAQIAATNVRKSETSSSMEVARPTSALINNSKSSAAQIATGSPEAPKETGATAKNLEVQIAQAAKAGSGKGALSSGENAQSSIGAQSEANPARLTKETVVKTAANVESLEIDSEKAKEAISSALNKNTNAKGVQVRDRGILSPRIASPVQIAQSQGSAHVVSDTGEGLETSDNLTQDVSKKDAGVGQFKTTASARSAKGAAMDVARTGEMTASSNSGKTPASGAGEAVSDSTNTVKNSTALTGQHAREHRAETARPVVPGIQNRATNTTSNSGMSAMGGAQAMGATQGIAGAQSQSRGGDTNSFAKQDMGAQMKSMSGKGAEKASGDSGQAFDVKASSAGDARKAQAASKTQTTSYVTKTAEEVKEVISTLTKSIDRLVTNRPGSMNLRISFNEGGSMSIRISMDGGQVNTNMLTDVVGLEGAIKANWSELANDWNQRGVKLNQPQFSQSSAGSSGSGVENGTQQFDQREGRFAGSQGASENGERQSRGGSASDQADSTGNSSELAGHDAEAASGANDDEVTSSNELKTYA